MHFSPTFLVIHCSAVYENFNNNPPLPTSSINFLVEFSLRALSLVQSAQKVYGKTWASYSAFAELTSMNLFFLISFESEWTKPKKASSLSFIFSFFCSSKLFNLCIFSGEKNATQTIGIDVTHFSVKATFHRISLHLHWQIILIGGHLFDTIYFYQMHFIIQPLSWSLMQICSAFQLRKHLGITWCLKWLQMLFYCIWIFLLR